MAIAGGQITVKGGSNCGIGSGYQSLVNSLTIRGGFFDCAALKTVPCFKPKALTFATGSVVVITDAPSVIPPQITQVSGFPQLYFEYGSNSDPETLPGVEFIQLQSVLLPYPASYVLSIASGDFSYERDVPFNSNRAQGCAFSVPSLDNYTVFASASVACAHLHHGEMYNFSPSRTPYIANSTVVPCPTQTWPPLVEEEPVPWKPVRFVLVVVIGGAAVLLGVSLSWEVRQVVLRAHGLLTAEIDSPV
jgi:hypothetical protein